MKHVERMRFAGCIPHVEHQMFLNIAAGLGVGDHESWSRLFQTFGGFADGIPVQNSYVTLPEFPGIGFESKKQLYSVYEDALGKLDLRNPHQGSRLEEVDILPWQKQHTRVIVSGQPKYSSAWVLLPQE
jgi:hypothetical protein